MALSAIEEIAVETSPFDVRYGRFLGGNINVVTKTGTNEFKGSLVTAFSNQDFTGNQVGEDRLDVDFREFRYGGTIGGPIIKDKLHFLVSVEGLDATKPTSVGPAMSGATNEVTGVTAAELDRVQRIAREVYGFDAGVPSRPLDEFDLKLLTKVDWALSQGHRLSAKYQRTSGNTIEDRFVTSDTLPLTSSWYSTSRPSTHFPPLCFPTGPRSCRPNSSSPGNCKTLDPTRSMATVSWPRKSRRRPGDPSSWDQTCFGTRTDSTTTCFAAALKLNYLFGDHL